MNRCESIFSASGISAGYGGRSVINGLSFTLEKGRLMGVLGANGSGKTTLLKSICGIISHEGVCTLEGIALEELSPRKLARLCGYIPQRSGIAIDIPALDVVLMGFNARLGLLEYPGSRMREEALKALERVGLGGCEQVNYLHLSEGQKQLCILARTMVSGSRLLLLDEPESALDFRFRYRMLEYIRNWVRGGRYGVITLHDPMLALNMCDELLILNGGKCAGILRPDTDDPAHMEDLLSEIYGRICLTTCTDRAGGKHIVMLREGEDGL